MGPRATSTLLGHIPVTLQDWGTSLVSIIILLPLNPFSPLTTHPSPGFLTFKGHSRMVFQPFSLAYPLSDSIVTKFELNVRRSPASFTHTRVMNVARGIGVVWGMRGNQSGPRRSDVWRRIRKWASVD